MPIKQRVPDTFTSWFPFTAEQRKLSQSPSGGVCSGGGRAGSRDALRASGSRPRSEVPGSRDCHLSGQEVRGRSQEDVVIHLAEVVFLRAAPGLEAVELLLAGQRGPVLQGAPLAGGGRVLARLALLPAAHGAHRPDGHDRLPVSRPNRPPCQAPAAEHVVVAVVLGPGVAEVLAARVHRLLRAARLVIVLEPDGTLRSGREADTG